MFRNLLNFVPDRKVHASNVSLEEKRVTEQNNTPRDTFADLNHVPLRPIDKRLLVWSGKYEKIEDVPSRASRAVVAKAHSVCRVKACNYMMVATVIGAVLYIMSGKRDAEKGISLAKINQAWHEEYNRNYEEKQKKLAEQQK